MVFLHGLDAVPIRLAGKARFVALGDIPEPSANNSEKSCLVPVAPGLKVSSNAPTRKTGLTGPVAIDVEAVSEASRHRAGMMLDPR